MPFAQNANIAETAIAKQSAELTPNTTPTYSQQVFSGRIRPTVAYNEINVTDTTNALPLSWKSVQNGDLTVTVPAFPQSQGTYVKGILPTDTKTGAGDPFTHTFDPSGAAVWMTMFSTMPGALYETFADTLIGELTYEFGDDKLLKCTVNGFSKSSTRSVSSYTAPTTPEIISGTSEFFHTNGAVFKFDINATPASTTVTNVASGSLRISRVATPVPTADTFSTVFMNRERLRVEADLTFVFDTWGAYNATFYGGISGTTPVAGLATASLDFTFPCLNNANHDFRIKMPSLQLVADPPDPDPSGGPLFVHVMCHGTRPASGDLVNVLLRNAVSTAY